MRTETFSTPGKVKLEISLPSGDVDLETVAGDTTTVELEVHGRDGEEHERDTEIAMRQRGDRYEVVVAAAKNRGFNFIRGRDYRLRVMSPPETDVEAKIASADVEGRGRFGDVRVQTASGDVELEDVGGLVRIDSASGDVHVERAGELKLNSASGDIEVGIAKGSRLWVEAQSLSGDTSSDIDLESGETIESDEGPLVELTARTLSGDIAVRRA
jgi:DUF4097 and DUF4098 domain-containing protein YvlB